MTTDEEAVIRLEIDTPDGREIVIRIPDPDREMGEDPNVGICEALNEAMRRAWAALEIPVLSKPSSWD